MAFALQMVNKGSDIGWLIPHYVLSIARGTIGALMVTETAQITALAACLWPWAATDVVGGHDPGQP